MAGPPHGPSAAVATRALAWLRRCDARSVLLILLLALGVRLVCLARSDLIGTDSMRFLQAAQRFEHGEPWRAISDPYHPELAFFTATLNTAQNRLLGTPHGFDEERQRRERAAYVVVLTAGLALVWLQLDLARRLFPAVPAGAVGLLAACQPYLVRSSVDIMSDTLMLVWVMLALRAAAAPARLGAALVSGLATGLAYLARPEGLVALPTVFAFWLLRDRRRLAARAGLVAVGLATVALPYAVAISLIAGQATLTLKKDVYAMVGLKAEASLEPAPATPDRTATPDPARPAPPRTDPTAAPGGSLRGWSSVSLLATLVASLARILAGWARTAPEVLALAFLAGLWALRRQRDRADGYTLFALCGVFMVTVLVLLMASQPDPDYLSRRHLFLLAVLSLPLAARGLLALGSALGERSTRLGPPRGAVLVFGLTLLGLALHATSRQRSDQRAQLQAARAIVAEHGYGEIVFTDREKVVYYAGAHARPLPADGATLLRELHALPRAWVAFYYEGTECCGPLDAALQERGSRARRVARLEEPEANPPRTLLLYLSEQPASDGPPIRATPGP